MGKIYKVVQWATGGVGGEALKAIIMHPQLELVGVKVYSDAKAGKDAGVLCGMPDTGVIATQSVDEIIALDADCVSYMPNLTDFDQVCALLRSGKNIACSPFLFYAENLPLMEREKLRAACEAGSSSVHGTGIHPGFVGMVLPLALSGMSRRIDKIVIQERADLAFYNRPMITFDNMRFGYPSDQVTFDSHPFLKFNANIFTDQISMLAKAMHLELDDIKIEHEVLTTDESYDIICGRIEKDTVHAQRYLWQGMADGKSRIEIDALWTVGGKYPEHWPKPKDGWTVTLEGDPSFQTHFIALASFENASHCSLEDHVHATETATAMQVINTIPALCEADAGIRGTHELGGIYSGLGMQR